MTVYCVWVLTGGHEPDQLLGIFSTKEKAETFEHIDYPDARLEVSEEMIDSGKIEHW